MALNFKYRTPSSLFELISQPTDPYKANYDKVFIPGLEPPRKYRKAFKAQQKLVAQITAKAGRHGQPE